MGACLVKRGELSVWSGSGGWVGGPGEGGWVSRGKEGGGAEKEPEGIRNTSLFFSSSFFSLRLQLD